VDQPTTNSPDFLMKFPCFVIAPKPVGRSNPIEPIELSDPTDIVILHDAVAGRALLPTFTEFEYAVRFTLVMPACPRTAHVARVETPVALAALLNTLTQRAGMEVDLLIDASDSFPGWQVAYSVVTEVMAHVA
jgi:hypothetical protein